VTWVLLIALTAGLGAAFAALVARRRELRGIQTTLGERQRAIDVGAHKAELQYPVIDLSRCLGCGTCVRACPEDGVLALVHGQAAVVRGAHCVGTAACARECPTGAITVTLADLAERRDVPVLKEHLEAIGRPGLFLAGEVTAHALVKTAVDHGVLVAAEVAQRSRTSAVAAPDELDLVIVGAGPAGLAAALEAKRQGLRFEVIDQETEAGGTVARYPRRKLVLTQPIELPLHGRLAKRSYAKEELIELWRRLVQQHQLPVRLRTTFEGLTARPDGGFEVRAGGAVTRARHVCIAVGRRGVPKRLGVPGEERPNVAYSLLDADSYVDRDVLVVGGGDSAIEAALGLAANGSNRVVLSYRREALVRVKPKNQTRFDAACEQGSIRAAFGTHVERIADGAVELRHSDGAIERIANDDVLVMAGGTPPLGLLEASGVSFDPALREQAPELGEQGTGLVRAVGAAFALALFALAFALWQRDYYGLAPIDRPAHSKHDLLRPGLGLGLGFGIAGATLIAANLAYILRRSGRWMRFGSLTRWMTVHVATGVLAFLCVLLHAAFAPRDTVGGQAFWLILGLLATGALGRYLYAYVPRAANGRELELAEVRGRLARLADGFERVNPSIAALVRDGVGELVERRQWRTSLPARLAALFGAERGLRRLVRDLRAAGFGAGLAPSQVEAAVVLTRQAHRSALVAAHLEDLRGLLASWRWLHRWGALLLVLLIALHVVYALLYGAHFFGDRLT